MGIFGGAFRPGGAGRDIAGYLGDALATLGGGRAIYGPLMEQRQLASAMRKSQNPDNATAKTDIEAAEVPRLSDVAVMNRNRGLGPIFPEWDDPWIWNYGIPYGGSPGMPLPGQPRLGPFTNVTGGAPYPRIDP